MLSNYFFDLKSPRSSYHIDCHEEYNKKHRIKEQKSTVKFRFCGKYYTAKELFGIKENNDKK